MSIKILDEYNFINEHPPQKVIAFKEWVARNSPSQELDEPHPEIFDKYIDDVYDSINSFGRDIGYNFTKRLPKYHQIHLLSVDNYNLYTKDCDEDILPSSGITKPDFKDIFIKWRSERTIYSTLKIVQHEIIHQLSSKNVYINASHPTFMVTLDYSIPNISDHKELGEAVTEMINLYLVKNYWHKYALLQEIIYKDTSIFYEETIKKVEQSICQMSKESNTPRNKVFRDLMQSYFEGDQKFLNNYNTDTLFSIKL